LTFKKKSGNLASECSGSRK